MILRHMVKTVKKKKSFSSIQNYTVTRVDFTFQCHLFIKHTQFGHIKPAISQMCRNKIYLHRHNITYANFECRGLQDQANDRKSINSPEGNANSIFQKEEGGGRTGVLKKALSWRESQGICSLGASVMGCLMGLTLKRHSPIYSALLSKLVDSSPTPKKQFEIGELSYLAAIKGTALLFSHTTITTVLSALSVYLGLPPLFSRPCL